MRWKIDDGSRYWHRWFAWFPVNVYNERVWLEYVWRRIDNCQGSLVARYDWTNPDWKIKVGR